MPSRKPWSARGAALWPLFRKELREIVAGRALWTMLLLSCPLVGYSFFQAVSLYGEASTAAARSAVVAASLSPLDGILVPTFGAFYVAVTLLFPFVAIRALGEEKQSGALRLLVQLPYRAGTLIGVKLAAVLCAWLICAIPVLSSLLAWKLSGGHLAPAETMTLVFGHLLYGLLVGAMSLFAASIADSSATAAIVTLAFTIGSWVVDFTLAGRPGWMDWLAGLSLTRIMRTFEQGLLSTGQVAGVATAVVGFAALAATWIPPGIALRQKLMRSAICIGAASAALALAAHSGTSVDVTEDRRNSFSAADERELARLTAPLMVTVHLAAEDPRYIDLERNVLARLERAMRNVSIRLAAAQQSFGSPAADAAYGFVEYRYGAHSGRSPSTSPEEVLPLIYGLAGQQTPASAPPAEYPGYPHAANGDSALLWFLVVLPALIAVAWWRSTRLPPPIPS